MKMFFFFFSSRRRHTSLTCDWSSDVCSSDLGDHLITQNLVPSKTTANGGPNVFSVKPGGADWFLDRGTVKLRSDGRIKVRVRGLVLANNVVPPGFVVSASLFCNGDAVPPAPTGKAVGTTTPAVPLG